MKVSAIVILASAAPAVSFSPQLRAVQNLLNTKLGADPGPPLNWGNSAQPADDDSGENEEEVGTETLKANRWSKHAPDTNLPTDEFKNQLKENMKRDLERRRAADPNRGNQPAKSYLDSL